MRFVNNGGGQIKEGLDYSFKKGVLVIIGKNATKVSGLMIEESDDIYYCVRYLDSKQFAALAYPFMYDVGYGEEGDREAYYTEEELARQAARKAAREAERKSNLEAAYSYIEGNWKTADGSMEKHFIRAGEDFMYEKCEEYKGVEAPEGLKCYEVKLLDAKVYEENGIQYVELYYHEGVYDCIETIEILSDTEIYFKYKDQMYTKY